MRGDKMLDAIRELEKLIKNEFPETDNLRANLMANRILDTLELIDKTNDEEELSR